MKVLILFSVVLTTLLNMAFAVPSSGCGKAANVREGQQYTMQVNGKNRQYYLKLPENYSPDRAHKLIFTYHQLGADSTKMIRGEDTNRGGALPYYGLPPLSNNSAIFVVPNGLNNGWGNQGGEDLTFFDQLVKTVSDQLCVESDLIFSTGFSYGGAMSYAIACARPDVIRAIAVLSGAPLSGCQGGTKPVAFYGQHGTSDSVLNVGMGRQIKNKFVTNNGCTAVAEPQPNGAMSVKTVYQGCTEGYPVTWVIHNGDHNPSQRDGNNIFAPGYTWEFFSQFE